MGQVIGELLPLAVGVAISPIPVIAVILMLFAPRARATSIGFAIGWLIGVLGAVVVFVALAAGADTGSDAKPSALVSWIKLALGVLLIALAGKQWRGRPAPDAQPAMPKWMAAIDSVTPAKAAGIGFALAALNPKNLARCIATGSLSGGGTAVAVAVFWVIACATVVVPVFGYAVAADRMRGPLQALKTWLERDNATVMSVLLLVIGAVLVGKGLGGLL
jgi:threonine/homoserine/homoserine lactone efflux protein